MLSRHASTGRLLELDYFLSIGDAPLTTYNAIKNRSEINGYRKIDNDVAFGQGAIEVENTISRIGTGAERISAGPLGRNPDGQRTESVRGTPQVQKEVYSNLTGVQ